MQSANRWALLALIAAAGGGCSADALTPETERPDAAARQDLAVFFLEDGGMPPVDAAVGPCDDGDPLCHHFLLGPVYDKPFPLPTDDPRDPAVAADGVGRDDNGWLMIYVLYPNFHYVWLPQDTDGTVAKVDTRTMKEVARYRSVTCFSRPTGSHAACDGTNGCCAADSEPEWRNRKNKMPDGAAQQVQLDNNSPSRTAVDFNGDFFVANQAFGGQSSVTKIANDLFSCKDRNKNGRIDTSSDVNNDGRIDPKDPKEFLDLDDECILWTTNQGPSGSTGRPLALGPGALGNGLSDAYAGGYGTGTMFRIDGTSGKTKDEWKLPEGCHPYGLVIDSQGFGWAPNDGMGPLCYFDTRNDANVGQARGTITGYGIAVDRDQDIWIGGGVARYAPDRSKGFATIGKGWWTRIDGLAGKGIVADSRNNKKYFVWSASANGVVRIPASEIPVPRGMDTTVPLDPNWPKINVDGYGVGIDADQGVIAAPQSGVVTRTKVDFNGDFLQPDVVSPPKNGTLCPAGDRCDVGSHIDPYSDFTNSFVPRNIERPASTWNYVVRSACLDEGMSTRWSGVTWDADVPPNTSLSMHARSGPTPKPDASWGTWTWDFKVTPVDFSMPDVLVPNGPQGDAGYLQIEFTLKTNDRSATSKLKSLDVTYRCEKP